MESQLVDTTCIDETSESLSQSNRTAYFWKLASVSQRGSSHEIDGRPCQDVHSLAMVSREMLVIVVADGAGSAKLAEVGADLAVVGEV